MSKIYLVTGGSGFLGSALVKRLVKEGYKVRVLDNNFRGLKERLKEVMNKIEFVEGDIRDSKKVKKAMQKIDGIFHLAFIQGTRNFYQKPELVLDVAVKGMINLIESARENKVKEFFLASSSEVYQSPPTIPTPEEVPLSIPDVLNPRYSYAGGKIINELMAINYGRKCFERVIIFRPHNIYGPDMGKEHVIPELILKIRNLMKKNFQKELQLQIQGDGNQTRAFCYISDFIEALIILLKKGKHLNIYHIGNPEEIKIKDLVEKIGNILDRKIKIVPGPPAAGSPQRRCPDISKISRLGYRPRVSLDKGLVPTVDWYLKNI